MSNEKDHKPAREKTYKLVKGENFEIAGLPFVVTNEKLKNPNFIIAIQNHERRTGVKILGEHIILA